MQGLDIETYNPETGKGELDPAKGYVRLVQIRDDGRGRVYDGHDPKLPDALHELDDPVAHNATFERRWIDAHYGIDLEALHDTMVMSQVLYTGTNAAKSRNLSHKLEAVASREIKAELDKDEQESDWNAEELTREQIEYAARNAAVLPELARTLLRKIDRAGLREVYEREVYELELRVSHAVDAMQRNGFAINEARLDPLVEEVTAEA